MRGKAPSLPPLQPSFNTCVRSTHSSLWAGLFIPWLIWAQPYPHSSSPVQILACQQAGIRQTWPLFIVSLCCFVDTMRREQASPLEGFSNLLPPPGGFAALSQSLAGLRPGAPRHVETCRARGRGERRRHPSTRWVMRRWTWGEEAPIGSHVSWRSSFEDAVEEVLQIGGIGRTCGVLRVRPMSCGVAVVLWTEGDVIGHTVGVRRNTNSLTTSPLCYIIDLAIHKGKVCYT